MNRYNVFHRVWWKENPTWPNGLEPYAGPKAYIAEDVSEDEALAICKDYNESHDPGRLSRKAEFEEA